MILLRKENKISKVKESNRQYIINQTKQGKQISTKIISAILIWKYFDYFEEKTKIEWCQNKIRNWLVVIHPWPKHITSTCSKSPHFVRYSISDKPTLNYKTTSLTSFPVNFEQIFVRNQLGINLRYVWQSEQVPGIRS